MSKQFLPLLLLLANPAAATSELTNIAIGIGTGEAGVNTARAALVQTIEPFWFGHLFPQLTLQLEYGANRWQDDASTHYAYSLLPNIRWNWQPSAPWQWFTELGVGVSYLEDTEISISAWGAIGSLRIDSASASTMSAGVGHCAATTTAMAVFAPPMTA